MLSKEKFYGHAVFAEAFSQNYDQKKKELATLCKAKVLAEDLDSYIHHSTAPEIAVTVTNVSDKKPACIVLSENKEFTKIPDDFFLAGRSET